MIIKKWICESSIESAKLIIHEYVSDDDTLEYSISSEGNLKTLIDYYYNFRIQQFDKQILSQPSKTISDSNPYVDEDLLKEILKHFNAALKYGCRNLIREFCKQLKKFEIQHFYSESPEFTSIRRHSRHFFRKKFFS